MIEALVAAFVAALMKEAPGALVAFLRKAGVLPDDLSDDDVAERLGAADILGDVNPIRAMKRRPRDPAAGDHWPDEYEKPETD